VLDPIDGTRAFLAGLPTWCVLIGLVDESGPTVSVIDQPHTGERFSGLVAGERREAWLDRAGDRRPLAARAGASLDSAIVSTTDPYMFAGAEAAAFEGLRRRAAIARYGLDAYAYAALALGGVDLVVESGLKTWDVAALVPVVQGAGGVITDWSGRPCHEGGQVLAAADPALHAEALALLSGAAD
jgi:fructose-1,6-bisphosphatase/inositol monophosphatase family enzyme